MGIPEISGYGQYKRDVFAKLNVEFVAGKSILDIGCGDGTDAEIFIREFGLMTSAIDVYEHPRIHTIENLDFKIANILDLPFENGSFDYVFIHDVLHHVDEKEQSRERHLAGLRELKRVVAKNGTIIIVEANRYNPISYIHMVKRHGHDHWKQSYFFQVVREVFQDVRFRTFEAHAYPWGHPTMWYLYEYFMEHMVPGALRSYNVAMVSPNEPS